jgi:long-subunit fatty acid transport protein
LHTRVITTISCISVAFNRIRYKYDHVLDESVIGGETFRSYRYGEGLDVTGNGITATLGAIYKISPELQVGASFSSPTYTNMRESFYQNAEVVPVVQDNNIPNSYSVAPNDFNYNLLSPFRASGGVTYFVGAKKAGFVTASIDFVGYKGMRVFARDLNATDARNFKEFYKSEISETYKNIVNLRLGGEYRVNVLRLRLGLAYLPDPYSVRTDNINRSKLIASAGLGVRFKSVFVDLAGNFNTFKSSFTPYALNDQNRYFTATTNNNVTNAVLTVGMTF